MTARSPRAAARSRWAFALAAALACAALGAPSRARADDTSEARRHAQRASSLAASGKCKQAVVEFDKALAVIRDPALLFNRAECHRKLGESEAALEDYNQFLADLPKAPNRKLVESRIAEISKAGPKAASPKATAAEAPAAGKTVVAPRPTAAPPAPPSEPAPSPGDTLVAGRPAAVPSAPPPVEERPAMVSTSISSPDVVAPAQPTDESIASRPWFWIAVGVAVVAVAAGTFVAINRDGTSVPKSELGNYKF